MDTPAKRTPDRCAQQEMCCEVCPTAIDCRMAALDVPLDQPPTPAIVVGGRQQAAAADKEKLRVTHFNISLEMLSEHEVKFMEKAVAFFKQEGITFKEVGDGPSRFGGKRCPLCGELIHFMAVDCQHCGKRI